MEREWKKYWLVKADLVLNFTFLIADIFFFFFRYIYQSNVISSLAAWQYLIEATAINTNRLTDYPSSKNDRIEFMAQCH